MYGHGNKVDEGGSRSLGSGSQTLIVCLLCIDTLKNICQPTYSSYSGIDIGITPDNCRLVCAFVTRPKTPPSFLSLQPIVKFIVMWQDVVPFVIFRAKSVHVCMPLLLLHRTFKRFRIPRNHAPHLISLWYTLCFGHLLTYDAHTMAMLDLLSKKQKWKKRKKMKIEKF